MKLTFIIIFSLFLPVLAGAQGSFIRSYGFSGYNEGVDIHLHPGGYLVVANSSFPGGNTQVYLLKTGLDGTPLWDRAFFQGGITRITQAAVVSPDSILLGGTTHVSGQGYHFFMALVDTLGGVYWEQSFGGEGWHGINAFKHLGSRIWITGYSLSTDMDTKRAYAGVMDMDGSLVREQVLPGSTESELNAMDMLGDTALVAVGYVVNPSDSMKNGRMLFLDTALNILMDTVMSDTAENNFLFCQYHAPRIFTGGYHHIPGNSKQGWVFVYNMNLGGRERCETGGGANDDVYYDVTVTPDGSAYYYTGFTESFGQGKKDIFNIQTNFQGYWLKGRTYGHWEDEVGRRIISDHQNRVIVCGYSESWGAGYRNIILMVADSVNETVPYWDHFVHTSAPKNRDNLLHAYPNPFTNQIYVEVPGTERGQPHTLVIRHITGQHVATKRITESQSLSTSHLKPGVYMLELQGTGRRKMIIKVE